MSFEAVECHTFSAPLDCFYRVYAPPAISDRTCLFVTLHGFSQDGAAVLPLTGRMADAEHVIAAPDGPSAFYVDAQTQKVGHSWITREHAASWVRLHHEIVLHVLGQAGQSFAIPPERRFLVGFSQSVGLNYRFAGTYPNAVRGVVGLCGGVPSDWETGNYRPVTAALLHIARDQDEFYPPEVTRAYAERLRKRAADVEVHLLPGGHRFPSKAGPLLKSWLDRLVYNVRPD